MSVLVVGSVAFDSIETPFGSREEVVGGAATYFALAASCFTKVHVVGRISALRTWRCWSAGGSTCAAWSG